MKELVMKKLIEKAVKEIKGIIDIVREKVITKIIEDLQLALKNPNYFNETTLESAIQRIIDNLENKLKK